MEKDREKKCDFSEYRVIIPEELDHLIKGFLSRRAQEVKEIEGLVNCENWSELTRLGHKIKGHGSGFGFEGISKIGEKIEEAAMGLNKDNLVIHVKEYSLYIKYLDSILSEPYGLSGGGE